MVVFTAHQFFIVRGELCLSHFFITETIVSEAHNLQEEKFILAHVSEVFSPHLVSNVLEDGGATGLRS